MSEVSFLDISKAIDRVWHGGLNYKIKCVGINSTLTKLTKNILEWDFKV